MDKERVILMSKLALYDKRFGKKDRKANEYFNGDYVYIKNSWTRFFVFVGCLLALALRWLYLLSEVDWDFMVINIQAELISAAVFIGAALFAYTIISSKIAYKEHKEASERVQRYYLMLSKIKSRGHEGGKEVGKGGAAAYITRDAN